MFEETIGISMSTGYDWTHTSEETMSEEETFEVNTTVPPGFILQIKQAQGECGGSTAKTELFKIVHIEGKTGRIVKEEFERTLPNGQTIKIENPFPEGPRANKL